jgi:hypothetical protein
MRNGNKTTAQATAIQQMLKKYKGSRELRSNNQQDKKKQKKQDKRIRLKIK